MHIFTSFIAARNKETIDYDTKPFLQFEINSEAEFKSWLGQMICNMWDIYKVAETAPEIDDRDEIDVAVLKLFSNPLFYELRNWVRQQKTKDTGLIVKLGVAYQELINSLQENNIIFMPGVELEIDETLGANDREAIECK